jgi:ribose transport system permease protein
MSQEIAAAPGPPNGSRPAGGSSRAYEFGTRWGLVILTLLIFAGFAILLPDTFPTKRNVFAILGSQATLGILALAVMIPLVAGQFDLSVGNILGFSAVFSVWAVGQQGMDATLAIVLTIAIGITVGFVNAFFVVIVGLSAFIATLGTATILGGLALLISGGRVLFGGLSPDFVAVGQTKIGGLPMPFLYLLALVALTWYLLEYTPLGRLLTAVGLGGPAARLAGIRTRGLVTLSFVLAGGLAAIAGVVQGSRLASATATAGPEFLLPAFAGAFLGATTVKRGQFNAWGTFVGVFFLAIGINGLQQLGAPFYASPLFNGSALLIAVSLTFVLARRTQEADQ